MRLWIVLGLGVAACGPMSVSGTDAAADRAVLEERVDAQPEAGASDAPAEVILPVDVPTLDAGAADVPCVTTGPEVCDGVDNDCNGLVDDTPPLTCGAGACFRSVGSCVQGRPNALCFAGNPQPETCNGIDDNCDGQVDEGFDTVNCGVGVCMRSVSVCAGQTCVPGQPAGPEACNGLDDDCNAIVDDGAPCPSGQQCRGGMCQ